MKISHFVMLLSALYGHYALALVDKAEPTTGFNITGYIQDFSVDNLDDPLSSATITVNGIKIIIPKNLKIVMPGSYLTANDIFRGPHGRTKPKPADEQQAPEDKLPTPVRKYSCIALNDRNSAEGKKLCEKESDFPYTAEIMGNIADVLDANGKSIGQEYIAGLVNIGQIPLQTSSGFIKTICYAGNEPGCTVPGELLIAPTLKSNFIAGRVRLNDPNGRFGLASLPEQDNRFKVDDGNPTVHAATGYPVCIPRNSTRDTECPMTNRPTDRNGNFLHRFTIGSTQARNKGIPVPGAETCLTGCDSHFMAPLVVGDYIVYSGTLQKDPNGGTYISVYSLEADLGIYTSPGVDPAYVFIEEALLGTGGTAFMGIDQETGPGKAPTTRIIPGQTLVTRFKIVGFTTDPSRTVDVYPWDNNINPSRALRRGIATEVTAPIGRFEMSDDTRIFLPIPREVRAQISGTDNKGKMAPAANGLEWGKYDAPVAEYLFPEGRVFGGKAPEPGLIPANFEDLCFLSVGSGQLDTLDRCTEIKEGCSAIDANLPIIGSLSPWPASEREPRQRENFPTVTPPRTRSTHQPAGIFCPQPPTP